MHRSKVSPESEFALLFDELSGSSAPQSFGAYRVLHQIGSGVLGPVFRSYDPQRDRLIAVKAFKLDIVPEDAQRLADSLRPMCDAPSPDRTLVRLLETGVAGSTAYVAMEFASGESLDVALRHLAPAPLATALPMLEAMAGAIDSAWAGGVGHGALHPRDVIVAPGTLDVRVTGFGIRPALENLGVVTAPRRPYSAPERTAGQVWDIRADVYALGAIAHELLIGRRALGSGEPEEATLLHRVLAKAMAAEPDDRFPSARAFVEALDAVAHSEQNTHRERSERSADLPVAAVAAVDLLEEPVVEQPFVEASAIDEPAVEELAPEEPAIEEPAVEEPAIEEPVVEARVFQAVAEEPLAEEDPIVEPPYGEPAIFEGPVVAPVERFERERPVEAKPLWAPFMTQPIPDRPVEAHRRYAYPWGALAAMLVAGVVLGATGMNLYLRDANPAAMAELPPAPPAADPSRAETEVQVAPSTPPATAPNPPAPADLSAKAPPPAAVAPPVRPETPVRAAAVTGRIVVRSTPSGALVTLDGRRAGETPLTLTDVSLGAHAVQVAHRGYVPETRKFTLTNRAPAQTISVPLRAGASETAAGSTKTGSIYADTRPRAARVVIDGRVYGTTPMLVPELSPGTHTVRLELDGYTTSSSSVTVRAGEQSRVSVSLVRR